MKPPLPPEFDDAWVGPLLDLGQDASQALPLRLAAVSAVLRFPTGPDRQSDAARQL